MGKYAILFLFSFNLWGQEVLDLNQTVVIENNSITLQEYKKRIEAENMSSFDYFTSKDFQWNVPHSLKIKVAQNGELLNFFGSTMVFVLEAQEKGSLAAIQLRVRENFSHMASALSPGQFHLTLHDLFAGETWDFVAKKIKLSEISIPEKMTQLSEYLKRNPEFRSIKLIPLMCLPSVNTSMVISYLPASEKDFRILFNLHAFFDSIVELPYFLRPHVTIDYFKPHEFSSLDKQEFSKMLRIVNNLKLPEIEIDIYHLYYQYFTSMDEYTNQLKLEFSTP